MNPDQLEQTLISMSDVYEYAAQHPKSRTTQVLKSMHGCLMGGGLCIDFIEPVESQPPSPNNLTL